MFVSRPRRLAIATVLDYSRPVTGSLFFTLPSALDGVVILPRRQSAIEQWHQNNPAEIRGETISRTLFIAAPAYCPINKKREHNSAAIISSLINGQ